MALTIDGRLFHKCAQLKQKLLVKKSVRGFVFRISKSIVRAEGFKLACQVLLRLII